MSTRRWREEEGVFPHAVGVKRRACVSTRRWRESPGGPRRHGGATKNGHTPSGSPRRRAVVTTGIPGDNAARCGAYGPGDPLHASLPGGERRRATVVTVRSFPIIIRSRR